MLVPTPMCLSLAVKVEKGFNMGWLGLASVLKVNVVTFLIDFVALLAYVAEK